jgi:amidase
MLSFDQIASGEGNMTGFSNYREYDGLGLAALVRQKAVSPSELLEAAVEAVENVNPRINFLSQKLYDVGLDALRKPIPYGPFSGVPFLIKDASVTLAGTATTQGSRLFADARFDADTTLVERYKRAGFVIFGKTTTPELALAPSTESSFCGVTRNPWDLSRTSGGSSGGAGAAVAAGAVPLAHASDGGGSIRIPASCCGLFGLKPTRARTPSGPLAGEGWGSLSVHHVISRSVRDSAAILDATAGAAPGDPYHAPRPDRSFLAEIGAPAGRLKIGFQRRPLSGATVEVPCMQAAEEAARLVESFGHHVEETKLPGDWEELSHSMWVLVASNVSLTVKRRARALGRSLVRDDLDPVTWSALDFAETLKVEAYPEALLSIHRQGRLMADFHRTFDVVMSPTLAKVPLPLGVLHTTNPDIQSYRQALAAFIPFTQLFNMTGQPSMTVPLYWTEQNLPVGVMFSAAFGDEATLFRLASQIEAARPWFHRVPEVGQ